MLSGEEFASATLRAMPVFVEDMENSRTGYSSFQTAKRLKGLSTDDMRYLLAYHRGNEASARRDVMNLSSTQLEKKIATMRGWSEYVGDELSKKAGLFYLPSTENEKGFEEQAADQSSLLENNGYTVEKIKLSTDEDFVKYWNEYANNYDDILIITHGGPHALSMGDTVNDNLVVEESEYSRGGEISCISELESGDFNIHLLSCNGGNLDHEDDNLAQAFDDITSGTVYSSDGSVSFYPASSSLIEKLNSTETGEKIASFIQEKTGVNLTDVYPEDQYGRRLSTVTNQDAFLKLLDKINILGIDIPIIRLPKGYYGLNDGQYLWDDTGEY